MTYYESAEDVKISNARAYREFKDHGAEDDWPEFIEAMGNREFYWAQDVLSFLGY